jgi:hypothetical protein
VRGREERTTPEPRTIFSLTNESGPHLGRENRIATPGFTRKTYLRLEGKRDKTGWPEHCQTKRLSALTIFRFLTKKSL